MPDDKHSAHCNSPLIFTTSLISTDESLTSVNRLIGRHMIDLTSHSSHHSFVALVHCKLLMFSHLSLVLIELLILLLFQNNFRPNTPPISIDTATRATLGSSQSSTQHTTIAMATKPKKFCPICCADGAALRVSPTTCSGGHDSDQRACFECWEAYLSKEVEEQRPENIKCMFKHTGNSTMDKKRVKDFARKGTFERSVPTPALLGEPKTTNRDVADTKRRSTPPHPSAARIVAGPASATPTNATRLPSRSSTAVRRTAESSPASSATSRHASTATAQSTRVRAAPSTARG